MKKNDHPVTTDDGCLFSAGVVHLRYATRTVVEEAGRWNLVTSPLRTIDFVREDRALIEALNRSIDIGSIKLYGFSRKERFTARVKLVPIDLPSQTNRRRTLRLPILRRNQGRDIGTILSRTVTSRCDWEGLTVSTPDFLHEDVDRRTLSEIFSNLPSPVVEDATLSEASHRLIHSISCHTIPGFKVQTRLHLYQERTLSRLLHQEMDPGRHQDPTVIQLRSIAAELDSGEQLFYLDPVDFVLRKEPELYTSSKGGILAEELGMGKTVIILALILCTRDHFPGIPEDISDVCGRVWTPSLLKHSITPDPPPSKIGIPSLSDMIVHKARTSDLRYLGWDEHVPEHLYDLVIKNTPYYWESYQKGLGPAGLAQSNRIETKRNLAKDSSYSFKENECGVPRFEAGSKIFVSKATLIVVPVMLLKQWEGEIMKHTEDGALQVLTVRSRKDVPSVEDIASCYDVVLINDHIFPSLMKDVSRCSCRAAGAPSSILPCPPPLLHIRWKRLVIDEGNTCANHSQFVEHLASLNTERRWIVTGTPTTNLVGGNVGMQHEDVHTNEELPESKSTDSTHRIWSQTDRADIIKLGVMTGSFLSMAPFHQTMEGSNGLVTFRQRVIEPLFSHGGPRWGSRKVLEQAMDLVIVRHRAEELDYELDLPPYTHSTILLDLDYYAAKTYNMMQTAIAVNAVDSERTGPDYLFSVTGIGSLRMLSENISQSLFWHFDEDHFDVEKAVERTLKAIESAKNRSISVEDQELLSGALKYQQDVAQDHLWRRMMSRDDIPFRVYSLPGSVAEALSRPDYGKQNSIAIGSDGDSSHHGEETASVASTPSVDILSPSSLTRLRETVQQYGSPVLLSRIVQAQLHDVKMRHEAAQMQRPEAPSPGTNQSKQSEKAQGVLLAGLAMCSTTSAPRKRANGKKSQATAKHIERVNTQFNMQSHFSHEVVDPKPQGTDPINEEVSLHSTVIGPSGSSKLDFILSEVVAYSRAEKMLIFSAMPMTLAHISEALKMIGINFLGFRYGITRYEKEQIVTTFKTSDSARVLLMELKDGARGLNIVEASRIIFCEPVWTLDVQTQAIKRAHRIGQTKPITVKTLAIRSTVEEEIMRRRQPGNSSKDVCTDEGMRGFIKNPKFIGYRTINKSGFPLLPTVSKPPPRTPQVKGALKRESREITADGDGDDISRVQAKKKRVQLRFADE